MATINYNPGNQSTEGTTNDSMDVLIGREPVPFFSHYESPERIALESTLGCIALLINSIVCIWSTHQQHQHYAYYALLRNMTFANSLFCISLWLSNNILLFANVTFENFCLIMFAMIFALIFNSAFGLISATSLFGFSVVHYLAVCHPLTFPSRVSRKSTLTYVIGIWTLYMTLAMIASAVLGSAMLSDNPMTKALYIDTMSRVVTNVGIVMLQIVLILTIVVCLRIHIAIRAMSRRLSVLRWEDEMDLEKRTFRSIVFLVVNLILLYLPFNVVYLVTVNNTGTEMFNNKSIVLYMTLLPYVKCAFDPILYKTTFADFQSCYLHVNKWCKACWVCPRRTERLNSISTRMTRLSAAKRDKVYKVPPQQWTTPV